MVLMKFISSRHHSSTLDNTKKSNMTLDNSTTRLSSCDLDTSSDAHPSKPQNDNSTTQTLRLQYTNKVRESASDLYSKAVLAKLEEESITLHKLHFDNNEDIPLHGRTVEIQKLYSKLTQYISTEMTCVISIVGTSGTGKTVLAKQLMKPTRKAGGFFGLGKFDLQNSNRTQPYAAFMGASYELGKQILHYDENNNNNNKTTGQGLRKAIHDAVGDQGMHLLLEVFPGLSKAFKTRTATTTTTTDASTIVHTDIEQKMNQLQFTVRQLFRVLSSKDSPLVLVLDDIQWADTPSLNLIEALLTDRETAFVLVATVRAEEISQDHAFQRSCKALQNIDASAVDTISIQNISPLAVQSVVANALRESEEYVKSLSDIVHEKTDGNPFFVIEFLQMLVSDDLLTYNMGMMKWLWEDGIIQGVPVTDNVGSLLARRIDKLPNAPQSLLKVAACLGQKFGVQTLSVALDCLLEERLLEKSVLGDFSTACQQCIDAGLLDLQSDSQYTFVHDQIQAVSSRLVSEEEERQKFQLVIGQGLLKHLSQIDESDAEVDTLFLAVDLCNSAGSLIMDEQGKHELASSNWKAARKAMDKSAFASAIVYGKAGLLCLKNEVEPSSPEEEEDDSTKSLKLNLHTILAEASFCVGDRLATDEYAQKIIDSDCSFHEKFDGYVTNMLSQFNAQKVKDATETSLFIQRQLGFFGNVATTPSLPRVVWEIVKTKTLMKKYTEEDLMNLPPMEDENRLRSIKLILRTSYMTFTSNPNLYLVQALTAMRWTLKYGISEYSPPILADYATVVCGVLEDFDTGVMVGDVAVNAGPIFDFSDVEKLKEEIQDQILTEAERESIEKNVCQRRRIGQDGKI